MSSSSVFKLTRRTQSTIGFFLFVGLIGNIPSADTNNRQARTASAFSLNGCNMAGKKAAASSSKIDTVEQQQVTPEMFGAIGDGTAHLLSSRYNMLELAQKEFPGVKDLNITIDGAAFQKAVDVASKNNGEVVAEKNYVINFPIITRNNTIIDGKGKGVILNDKSRAKPVHHSAFFFGDYSASAFFRSPNTSSGFNLYKVKGAVKAGQDYVQLAIASDIPSFKTGQLVMVASAFMRGQAGKKTLLPYHLTISKILRIDGGKLYFEYPIDEDVDSVLIAANGNYDPLAEINYEGVENVTLRNITVNAENLSLRSYGYKCHLDNIKIINATRVVGINAMAHSVITNISGTFSTRGIEIKTGSSDILVRNVSGTYKAIPNFPQGVDVISLGEYNRNIIIDSFNYDIGNQNFKNSLIDLHARKATISNGVITCKSQVNSFLKLFNERYVSDPRFGCYGNIVRNVKFFGNAYMRRNVLDLGDDADESINLKQTENEDNDQNDGPGNSPYTANVPPYGNVIEDCLFDGGSQKSYAALNQGQNNIVRNCVFPKAKLKVAPDFRDKNEVSNNKENNQ